MLFLLLCIPLFYILLHWDYYNKCIFIQHLEFQDYIQIEQIHSIVIMHKWLVWQIHDWERKYIPGIILIVSNPYIIADTPPEVPLTLTEFPQHQIPDHPSQANLPEQSLRYFTAINDNLPPPQHTPYLPHIYSNHPPSMFSPDLPPPPPTPQEMKDQNHSYQNFPPMGFSSSKRTLQRGQRFGDVWNIKELWASGKVMCSKKPWSSVPIIQKVIIWIKEDLSSRMSAI